jgi:hypothetical protein
MPQKADQVRLRAGRGVAGVAAPCGQASQRPHDASPPDEWDRQHWPFCLTGPPMIAAEAGAARAKIATVAAARVM